MNRFAATGLLFEATEGKKIAILSLHQREARAALEEVAAHPLAQNGRIVRANGRESIQFDGGGFVAFRSARSSTHDLQVRGLDVVFVDDGADPYVDYRLLRPALAASGGELIRA